MKTKLFFSLLKRSLQDFRTNYSILKNGQSNNYAVLQLSHRLEKGLSLNEDKQKHGWGWDKAQKLFNLLIENDVDRHIKSIGEGVLLAFMDYKKSLTNEIDLNKYKGFVSNNSFEAIDRLNCFEGGASTIETHNIMNLRFFEDVVNTRHSCREFDLSRNINRSDLVKAISLANRCPSACNRQPYHVYIISNETLNTTKEKDSEYSLIITGIINAFNANEYNDWIVSPSIFVGYLVLCLHYYGIASLVMRKELFAKSEYNEKIKKLCKIPKNEKIVLEVKIGCYKEYFKIAKSQRININDMVSFID